MKQIKNILLVIRDGINNTPAIKRAMRLTQENKAKLKIIEVIHKLPKEINVPKKVMSSAKLTKMIIEETQKSLNSKI